MSNTREIITLQFGNYANFVGTHFWNAQVSQLTSIIFNFNETHAETFILGTFIQL